MSSTSTLSGPTAKYAELLSFTSPKTWFVTGASRGLGKSIATAALAAGDKVFATARSVSSLNDLKAKYPDTLTVGGLDVTKVDAVKTQVQAAHKVLGRLDVVVNNAGYADMAAIEDASVEHYKAQMDTNFYGTLYVTQAVLPILRAQGDGHIFQISTIGARMGMPGLSAYQSAKWAVTCMSLALADEVKPLGIKVCIIEPGGIRTDWAGSSMNVEKVSEPYKATVGGFMQYVRNMDGKQIGDPDKMANVIVNLSRNDSPPLELLLTSEAYLYAKGIAEKRTQGDDEWKVVSDAVDF